MCVPQILLDAHHANPARIRGRHAQLHAARRRGGTDGRWLKISMLRSFHIENFKSLSDFTMSDMGQFVCLIGLNGAGKTSLIQAIDFMAHLASGDVNDWIQERDWTRSDLTTKPFKKQLIRFKLSFDFGYTVIWEGTYNISLGRCRNEKVSVVGNQELFVEVSEGKISFKMDSEDVIHLPDIFDYQGSVVSFIEFKLGEGNALSQFQVFIKSIKSLELLAPHRMRSKSRTAEDLGVGGEKLSGYLHGLTQDEKQEISSDLKKFYRHLVDIGTTSKRAGWAQISALEKYEPQSDKSPAMMEINASHLNDGFLRILTIIAQTKTDHQFLLFDEIENGMNPEKIEDLMHYLLSAKQQVMVTTHNPLILNFLPDEKAKESVFFLYRNRYGATKATRFFEIPEVAQKLEVLGPGEAFLDTSLEELVDCIEAREVAA